MSTLRRIASLWRNLVNPQRVERDLHDELQAAFESLVDDYVRAGMAADAARRAAVVEFGHVEAVKERVRDVRGGASLTALDRDVRYAARLLRRNPVFSAIAVLSLATGIGATTTIVTVANGLLERAPAGVGDPGSLLDIFRAEEGRTLGNFTSSYPYFLDVRGKATSLAGVFAYELEPRPITVGAADGTELAFANLVSANYFVDLGVAPSAGRVFVADEAATPAAASIAVLSHRFWRRRFNANAAIIGSTVQINRHPFTVIGVAHEAFRGTNLLAPDVWMPIAAVDVLQPGTGRMTRRALLDLGMGGRLKPLTSRAQAAAELDAIARQIEREYPLDEGGMRLRVARLSAIPGPLTAVAAGLLALLLAIVSTVLVIACANVSGVLLARATARRREIAVRIAIGAGRGRLIRQLLTETALLFAIGGTAGVVLARAMTSLLLALLPAFPVPIDISLPLDATVVMFAVGVSFVAAVLSGLAPALHASRADVIGALKDESQGPSDRLRVRSAFVIAQVAFSCMLVVIAALLVQALHRIQSTNQNFDSHGVEVASLDLTAAGYGTAAASAFAGDLVDRLRALPGVEAATLVQWMPGRGGSDVDVTVPGTAPPAGDASFLGTSNAVDADLFRTLHLPILEGRDFTGADTLDREQVVIVSETTARYLWPGQRAVGRYLAWHETRAGRAAVSTLKVIGVVPDVKSPFGAARRRRAAPNAPSGIEGKPVVTPPTLMMYVPLRQRFTPRLTIVTRTNGGRPMAPEIRRLVKAMDANLPMMVPQPLDAQMGPVYLQIRIAASVAAAVGLVGLLLAAMGVYGVTAYTAESRTREIGVRMALGAQRGDIIRMVLRHGMSLVVMGSIIGLALAMAGSRLLRSVLADVAPLDVATFSAAAALFLAIGFAACYVPARRATHIGTVDALRYE
jgi:predicted permease